MKVLGVCFDSSLGFLQGSFTCLASYIYLAVSRSLADPCWSSHLSSSSLLSLPPDQTLPRQGPSQSLSFPENYQTLPKSTRHPSGGSSPPPRNLPSDYKYAQDRASHLKMSSEERRAHRDGTVWQLYEWQQRQQFRHGSPTAPISAGSPELTDQARSRSMLEVPRSISVPPSPSDLPPPGPPRVFPPRRPHTPAERVTVKPPDQRRSVDISLGDSPRKAWGHATKVRFWSPVGVLGSSIRVSGASRDLNTSLSNFG